MKTYQVRRVVLFLLLFCSSFLACAKSEVGIPPVLAPWQEWVMHGNEEKLCPIPYNQAELHWCVWPSTLSLKVEANQGTFNLSVSQYKKGWVPIPGETKYWPQAVKVNDKLFPVGSFQGEPAVYLLPGEYVIQGEFAWEKLPDNIQIPFATGLVSLVLLGQEIQQPDRDNTGRVWLRRQIQPVGEEDTLSLNVTRLIDDEIPLTQNTLIRLRVSGKTREVSIGPVLPPDSLALALNSALPNRLEDNGMLRLQIKPGTWEVNLKSRFLKRQDLLPFQKHVAPWPKEEVWAVKMHPDLRLIEIEGAPSIDPQQTQMPAQWKEYPTFLMQEGHALKLIEKRRGIETRQVEKVDLQRNIWLDFSGKEYVVQDTLTGNVQNTWRLQVDKNTALGRVNVDGQDRLITKLKAEDPSGVEIRQGQLNLVAVSQIPAKVSKRLAVGWDLDVQSLSALLHLPPGWKLLGVKGVDNVTGAWLEDWTLLDLFLVFIIAAAVMKLLGKKWGLLALLTLGLIYHENGAPLYSWLNLLASIALVRVIPEGTFKKWIENYYRLSLVVLVVVALPFLVKQVREAIYPQLSITQGYPAPIIKAMPMPEGRLMQEMGGAAIGPKSRAVLKAPGRKLESMADNLVASQAEMSAAPVKPLEDFEPEAKIQTGPGVPDWRFNQHQLRWNGPVLKDQTLRLWLLPASVVSVLKLLQVGLVMLLIYGLSSIRRPYSPKKEFKETLLSLFSFISLLPLLALLLGMPGVSNAQDTFPNDKLLNELRDRLLEPPSCLPDCAQISRMQIDMDSNQLTIRLLAQVVEETAIPLPSTLNQWMPAQVIVDGQAKSNLLLDVQQQLWVKLTPGVHEIVLQAPIGIQDKFELQVPLTPKWIATHATGWTVGGIFEAQLQGKNIYFTRLKSSSEQSTLSAFEPGRIPTFVQLQRTFRLGLEWEVVNELQRVAPQQGAINLSFPLMAGEVVLSDTVEVKEGKVYVVLSTSQQSVQWKSKLKIVPQLNLQALANPDVKEIWQLEAISQWHCDFKGIPILHQQDAQGKWMPTWQPWPSEKVEIQITRPQAVPGPTMTIENSRLQVTPGKRATENALQYTIRSNLGGTHTIQIPKTAEVKDVMIDGQRQPIDAKFGDITLPVNPGMQLVEVSWRLKEGLRTWLKTPQVNLNSAHTNSTIDLQLSRDRWILALGGPLLGPAVLFWGYLVVVLMVAVALGKSKLTPLNMVQWFLLATGLLIATPWAVILAVAWFVALNQRKQMASALGLYVFRFTQVGLVLLTFAFGVSLFISISRGLLGVPDMQLGAPGTNLINSYFMSSPFYQLQWYQDLSANLLPRAWVLSLPIFVYRTLMLLWALWLAFSLLKWLRWGWECFSSEGLWRQSSSTN